VLLHEMTGLPMGRFFWPHPTATCNYPVPWDTQEKETGNMENRILRACLASTELGKGVPNHPVRMATAVGRANENWVTLF